MATDRKRLAELAKLGVPFAFRVLLAKATYRDHDYGYSEQGYLQTLAFRKDNISFDYPHCGCPCKCDRGGAWTWTIPFTQRVKRRRDGTIKEKQYILTIKTEYRRVISCEKKRIG